MIIDFRVRPPFGSFRRFGRHDSDPSWSDEAALDFYVSGLRDIGVTNAVIMGRHIPELPGMVGMSLENADTLAMIQRHPDFFRGFGAVDIRDPDAACREVDRLADQGLIGIAFDNPLSDPPRHDDDPRLFAIYERAQRRGLMIALTASGLVGDITASHPLHVQAVSSAFPELPIIVPHGCWPWTTEAVGIVLRSLLQSNGLIYLMPDVYLHTAAPGRQSYIDALNWRDIEAWAGNGGRLSDRFLFGSSYPLQSTRDAVGAFMSVVDDAEAREAVLQGNARRLLRI